MAPDDSDDHDDDPTDEETVATVTDEVLARLDPDPVLVSEDTIILSKRAFLGGLGVATVGGGLAKLGIDEASAQSAAGQVGTSSEPVDLYAANYGSESVTGGYELTVEGDTYQFNE